MLDRSWPMVEVAPEHSAVPDDPAWWRAWANCRGLDPAVFFPPDGHQEQAEQAKDVCRGCEVRVPCREYAIADPELLGIWGGTTERQRKTTRARRLRVQRREDVA